MPTLTAMLTDAAIRKALAPQVADLHGGPPKTLIYDEFVVQQGDARVDIAAVNGALHGYEIKSDCDRLVRLPRQAEIYSTVLDTVTLVTTARHLAEARTLVPRWWGIWTASGNSDAVQLSVRRKAKPNPAVNPRQVLELLWREEIRTLLEYFGLSRRGYVRELRDRLAAQAPAGELLTMVRESIRGRGDWRGRAKREAEERERAYNDPTLFADLDIDEFLRQLV